MDKTVTAFFRYIFTGGIAALVDIGTFAGLISIMPSVLLAGIASFCVANIVNFALTSRIVFGVAPHLSRYPIFFGAALLGLMVNVTVTMAGVHALHFTPIAAKLLGIAVALFVNFVLNLIVVFRRADRQG